MVRQDSHRKTLKIAPFSVGIHAKLFDERKTMLVPHLTSSNNSQNLVKHLAEPAATLSTSSCSPRQIHFIPPPAPAHLAAVILALLKQWKRPVSMSLRPTSIIRYGNGSWVKKPHFLWCAFARITNIFH